MLTKSQLDLCKAAEIALCDKNTLTDLRDITVDKSKSVRESHRGDDSYDPISDRLCGNLDIHP